MTIEQKVKEIKSRYPEQCNIEGLEPAFSSDITEAIHYGIKLENERIREGLLEAFNEMYSCLEDVVGQYGGDFISTSERAEYLVEKYKGTAVLSLLDNKQQL